jgi:4-diphosphocytidyl-2-C-methyl-D-erythritol kinase
LIFANIGLLYYYWICFCVNGKMDSSERKSTDRTTAQGISGQKTPGQAKPEKVAALGEIISAPAKLNLSLTVLGRRSDGYHELYGLMARVALSDSLIFSDPRGPKDSLSYESRLGPLLEDSFDDGFKGEDNLVLKAIRAFRKMTKTPKDPVHVHIIKRIPLRAGLGGGSSDAAAALRHLSRRSRLEPSELKALALSLGGDVPFFLEDCPNCLAAGVGEKLTPYHGPIPGTQVLLINPAFTLSTKEVFRRLSLTILPKSSNSLIVDRKATFLERSVPRFGHNDLYGAALKLRPQLEDVRRVLTTTTPAPLTFGLSGSGPTFWALYETRNEAAAAALDIGRPNWWIKTTALEEVAAIR